jgi:tRNA (guanine37-N1)-methyltransferase
LKRSQKKKLIKIKIYNIRDFATDKHKTVDDRPYGGGAGMVMRVDVIVRTVLNVLDEINKKITKTTRANRTIRTFRTKIILLSARGKQFNQKMARDFAKRYKNIILICGHYEGIDERFKKVVSDFARPQRLRRSEVGRGFRISDLSIGPYILSGGESAAMVLVDAISRHIPGVLGKIESLEEKKGSYPVYTRPEVFEFKHKKYIVPKVLLSGNHKKISEWRKRYGKIIR